MNPIRSGDRAFPSVLDRPPQVDHDGPSQCHTAQNPEHSTQPGQERWTHNDRRSTGKQQCRDKYRDQHEKAVQRPVDRFSRPLSPRRPVPDLGVIATIVLPCWDGMPTDLARALAGGAFRASGPSTHHSARSAEEARHPANLPRLAGIPIVPSAEHDTTRADRVPYGATS